MDPQRIRQLLGLPTDATDQQVEDKLRAASGMPDATKEGTPSERLGLPAEQHVSTGDRATDQPQPPMPVVTPEGQPTPENPEGRQSEGGNVPLPHDTTKDTSQAKPEETQASAQVVTLDPATYAELRAGAQAGSEWKKDNERQRRESAVSAAVDDGRIPPARREHWLRLLEADYEGASATLASLQPGLIPVDERGLGGAQPTDGNSDDAYPAHWLPEVAARRAEIEARRGVFPSVQVEV